VTDPWSKRAFAQLVVVWQSSQVEELGMWVAGFPVAAVPLWQDAQEPETLA
jgi:hypothetical protein